MALDNRIKSCESIAQEAQSSNNFSLHITESSPQVLTGSFTCPVDNFSLTILLQLPICKTYECGG